MTTIALSRTWRPQQVAPWWHTALLAALFLGLATSGILFQRGATVGRGIPQRPPVVPLYLSLIAAEWGLFYYVWRSGLRRGDTTLRELIGGRWRSWKEIVVDAALALGLWSLWVILQNLWTLWIGSDQSVSMEPLLPQDAVESVLWLALSLSAGVCEELVFRGYFQRQFEALTRSGWVALALQAMLFGISHGYQGTGACSRIVVYGALWGLMARWRGSLRPGMMAHALTDIMSGIFRL